MKAVPPPRFMGLILSVCMVVPMSIDIFISSLPAIQTHFPGHNVTLVMGMSLIGLTLSQLFYGPLLDRFGRKPVIVTGLLIFTMASIIVVIANTFAVLIWARFVQAFGGSAAVVGIIAIVKDVYQKEQLMYKIGAVMAMIGISPVIAPFIGSILDSILGWRGGFCLLVVLGVFYTVVLIILFKETIYEKNKDALKISRILSNYACIIKTSGYLTYCFSSGFTYCILFSYLNISAFIIIKEMGFHVVSYGAIVAINALAIVIMAKIAPVSSKRYGLNNTIYLGLILILLGGLLMLLLNYMFPPTLLTFMAPVLVTTIGAGIIRPTANGGAIQLAPKHAIGSAAACFNIISFGFGAIVSIFSLQLIHTVFQFGIFILVFGALPLILMWLTFRLSKIHIQQLGT